MRRETPNQPFGSGSFYLVGASNFLNFDLSILADLRNALARSFNFLLQFLDRARQARDIANGLFGFGLFGFWLFV